MFKPEGMTDNKARRANWLDAAKGVAISIVVLGHILDGNMGKATIGQDWVHLYRAIYLFHMPLFFMLSGIAFAMGGNNRRKWLRAIANLLILYGFWQGLMFASKHLFSGFVNNQADPFWSGLLSPNTIYWYLLALATYYLVFILFKIDMQASAGKAVLVGSLLVSAILPTLNEMWDLWGYPYKVFYHFFYFAAGIYLWGEREKLKSLYKYLRFLPLAGAAALVCGAFAPDILTLPFLRPAAALSVAGGGVR